MKIGMALKDQCTVIGVKRNPPKTFTEFQIIGHDIFDGSFELLLKKINPTYLLYAVAADDQLSESYRKAYVDGVISAFDLSVATARH